MNPDDPLYPVNYPNIVKNKTWLKGYLANYTLLMMNENVCSYIFIPGSGEYLNSYHKLVHEFYKPTNKWTTEEFQQKWFDAWEAVTEKYGRESQIAAYRFSLQLPPLVPEKTIKEQEVGIIVGPIVGSLGFILLVLFFVVLYQRGALKRRTRDVTHAPKECAAIVFTDVQNSTGLWEQQPDAMRKSMDIHHTTIRKVIAKRKAYEVKTIGDSFMITCPSADDSVQVSNDIQDGLLQEPWPTEILDTADACVQFDENKKMAFKGLRVRIGVDIGKPEVVYDQVSKGYDYYGDVPNTAARVEAIAYGGQTLITKAVYDQLSPAVRAECNVVDVGDVALKGLTVKTHVYQVMPKHLTRNFSVPKQGTSAGTSEVASLRLKASAGKEDIEQMTMTEIAKELLVLRQKYTLLLAQPPAEANKNMSMPNPS